MTRRVVIVVSLVFAAALLLVALARRVSADRGSVTVAGGHNGHHGPIKGSRLYQYASPNGGPKSAQPAYNPEVPPPTPAPNGIREFELVIEEDVPHEVAP